MVTKKISKFPPPPKLKLTLSVYNRVCFFNFDMACKCQPRPVALGDRIDTFCCFLHDMSFSCMDFQNPSREFHDLISGFQNPSSEFHNLVLEFHNPPAEFHNTISKFHNASFTIRPASFRIQPPSVTIQVSESILHISHSDRQVSRFPLNFLMAHCIFSPNRFTCMGFLLLSKGCIPGPHDFASVSGLASHSGCLGPHEFTLVSPCLPLCVPWAA